MERSSQVLATTWKPKNLNFFKKVWNWQNWILSYPEFPYAEKRNLPGLVDISPTLVIVTSTERSSRVLQHGSHFFSKKVRNWIWLVLKSWNQHSSRSQHAPMCRHRGCIIVNLRVTSSFNLCFTISLATILQLWKYQDIVRKFNCINK